MAAALVAAQYVGIHLDQTQQAQLERFHSWLAGEATRAGGVGPNERDRLWRRHIADSLVFAVGFGDAGSCIDLGTGVGLPGIPLAVALPDVAFTLVDRARRRADLARRACAVLGLANCQVVQSDIADVTGTYPRLVSRASLSPARLMFHVKRILDPGGVAYIGLSTRGKALELAEPAPGLHVSVVRVPAEVLDSEVSLLRIEAT